MNTPPPLTLSSLRTLPAPRSLRRIAIALVIAFVLLIIALMIAPWQQNVQASGKVTALDPLDRVQVIPAPVSGRLTKLHVQEGNYVEYGQVLAEMADLDPNFAANLGKQYDFAESKVEAAEESVSQYTTQLMLLEDAREQKINEADYELKVAIQKVRAALQDLEAFEADYEQKRTDRERKSNLFNSGYMSELEFQEADAKYLSAQAKVESGKAKVDQARNEELAKMAKIEQISADESAKIEKVKSERQDALAKLAEARKDLTMAETRVARQVQKITAPRRGYIQRIHAATTSDLISQQDPLIELIPDVDELAVELWVRGVDAPLITPGRKVRLQFEGWPAVQFAGWPSVAIGTFGGIVQVVDAQGRSDGRFRVLIVPDPDDEPWPEKPYLRQGGRANGWLLLDTVRLGFEIWRQLNAFPPSVEQKPELDTLRGSKPKKGSGDKKDGEDKL